MMTQIYDFSLSSRPKADLFDRFLWGAVAVLRRWRDRREARALLSYNDRLLTDMGLSRSDVLAEVSKPLWKD